MSPTIMLLSLAAGPGHGARTAAGSWRPRVAVMDTVIPFVIALEIGRASQRQVAHT
jgi:hypothetical protein